MPLLPGLVDASIETAEIEPFSGNLEPLLPLESAGLSGAAARILEFRAGRHCARAALSRLGVVGVAIRRGDDRLPVWPSGIVGSITHTLSTDWGFAAAAVASEDEWRGVGVDAEIDEELGERLFPRVLTPSERAWLANAPEDRRGRLAKLVFSAKESFYKCQYPLSREFLGFTDVHVEISEKAERFEATLLRRSGPFAAGSVFDGRFAARDGVIVTVVTLRR